MDPAHSALDWTTLGQLADACTVSLGGVIEDRRRHLSSRVLRAISLVSQPLVCSLVFTFPLCSALKPPDDERERFLNDSNR